MLKIMKYSGNQILLQSRKTYIKIYNLKNVNVYYLYIKKSYLNFN